MKYGLVFACAVVMSAAVCPADEINVSGMTYTEVKITGFDGKIISFTFRLRTIKKEISQVKFLAFANDERFTEAERLVAVGRVHAAIEAYGIAERLATEPWRKALAKYRLKVARSLVRPPAGNGGAASNTCLLCKGTGKMWCTQCRVGEEATGKIGCPRCQRKGRTPCPQCHGTWRLDVCLACKGRGTQVRFDWRWDPALRKIQPSKSTVTCRKCGGRGATRVCQTCGTAPMPLRGTITCLTCNGTGVTANACPACKGAKKITCTSCGGTGKTDKKVTIAVKPPDNGGKDPPPKGNGSTPDTGNGGQTKPPPVSGPLASPDALVAAIKNEPKHPSTDKQTWAKLDIIQRDAAEEAHARAMVKWLTANEYRGKKISWSATFSSTVKTGDGPAGGVNARSAGGVLIRASVPAAARPIVMKLKKGDKVRMRGTIRNYGPVDPRLDPTAGETVYRIELAETTVAPV